MLLLMPGYSFQTAPPDLTAVLLRYPDASLLDEPIGSGKVSEAGLAPSIFEDCPLGWSAITRCLEGGCF